MAKGRRLEFGVRTEYSTDRLKTGPVVRRKNRPWCSCGWAGETYLNSSYGPEVLMAHLRGAHAIQPEVPRIWRRVLEFYGTYAPPSASESEPAQVGGTDRPGESHAGDPCEP